jgi:hypothetical protein
MSEPRLQGKSYDIPKRLIWDAWLKVRENGGAAGADGVTIEQFELRLKDNLLSCGTACPRVVISLVRSGRWRYLRKVGPEF